MHKALLLALLVASPAWAATKVSVLPFSGPNPTASRGQVVTALCELATCVPFPKVAKGSKPVWAKVKKEKVQYVVGGKVVRKKKKLSLELTALNKPGKPRFKKSFPLDAKGRLSEASLDAAIEGLSKALGLESSPPPFAESEPVPLEPASEPVVPEPVPEPPVAAARATERDRDDMRDDHVTARAVDDGPGPLPGAADPLFALELGGDLFARDFKYQQPETANLRAYSAQVIGAPKLKAELYPLSRSMTGIAAGLGVEASYSVALLLRSQAAGGPLHPTSLNRLEAGLRLNVRPFASSRFAIVPAVGFRNVSFSVAPASDGTTLDGLAGVSYSALALGAGVEAPLLDDQLVLFARGSFLPVLSSGEVISQTYFPRGSASGFELQGGAGYRVLGPVELRLAAHYTRFGLSFQSDPADARRAAGATDVYTGFRFFLPGLNLSLRYTY